DGVLDDLCWEQGFPNTLTATPRPGEGPGPQVLLCYDREHLYFAARVPRAAGFRTDGPSAGKRRHDEDLSEFDRIVVSLDVDRDYVTSYQFAVDQRGCTHDSCWHDAS